MTNTEARGFLPGRLVPVVVAVVVTALVVFAACFLAWYYLGGGVWRSEVEVVQAVYLHPRWISLEVDSCVGAPAPHVLSLRETDDEVQVQVVVFSTPFRSCDSRFDSVEVQLQSSLRGRDVVSKGQVVPVGAPTPIPP